jgi:hypothetical protein
MRRVSPWRCNRLEALAPSFLDAIRNEEIWNHHPFKKQPQDHGAATLAALICSTTLRHTKNIPAEAGI